MLDMASVALCPRCSHDLYVPNGTDPDVWAQCPACNVLFQVKDAIMRDLAELKLVEPVPESPAAVDEGQLEPALSKVLAAQPTPTVAIWSQKTVGDIESNTGGSDGPPVDLMASDKATSAELLKRSKPTVEDFTESSAPTWEESAVERGSTPSSYAEPTKEPQAVPRSDTKADSGADLASARTLDDISASSLPTSPGGGATIEFSGQPPEEVNTDFELEGSSAPPQSVQSMATWDDSEQMERLLGGDEANPTDDAPTPMIHDEPTATDEAAPTDEPFINTEMFSMPTGPRRRRPPSVVRLLTGIVLSGIVGIALGIVVLLWLLGPSGDIFGVARYLPSAILPASFAAAPASLADEPERSVDPDTKPANFAEPTTQKPLGDDATATETNQPARFEPSDVTPLLGNESPRVNGAPTFTPEQLAAALQVAKDAQPGLVKGDLRDGKSVLQAKGYSYSLLCDLAEKLTFVDAASRPADIEPLKNEANELFRQTLADAAIRDQVALIARQWVAYGKRQTGGVFFAGTVGDPTPKGMVVECQLNLDSGAPLTILAPRSTADRLPSASGTVGVVGSIVDSPAQHVSGYEGNATQAVWVGSLISLE
jgi:hypothetical protein